MCTDFIRKAALLAFISVFAVATITMNRNAVARSNAEIRSVASSVPGCLVRNIIYPIPCAVVQPSGRGQPPYFGFGPSSPQRK
jgi:hypothetical protein